MDKFMKVVKTKTKEYHIFYDKDLVAFDFYTLNKNTGETECITVAYYKVKDLYDVLTEDGFKRNYDRIMIDIVTNKEDSIPTALIYHTFAKGFWELAVLNKFKGFENMLEIEKKK